MTCSESPKEALWIFLEMPNPRSMLFDCPRGWGVSRRYIWGGAATTSAVTSSHLNRREIHPLAEASSRTSVIQSLQRSPRLNFSRWDLLGSLAVARQELWGSGQKQQWLAWVIKAYLPIGCPSLTFPLFACVFLLLWLAAWRPLLHCMSVSVFFCSSLLV